MPRACGRTPNWQPSLPACTSATRRAPAAPAAAAATRTRAAGAGWACAQMCSLQRSWRCAFRCFQQVAEPAQHDDGYTAAVELLAQAVHVDLDGVGVDGF